MPEDASSLSTALANGSATGRVLDERHVTTVYLADADDFTHDHDGAFKTLKFEAETPCGKRGRTFYLRSLNLGFASTWSSGTNTTIYGSNCLRDCDKDQTP
jgi:hypothetical protein